jgi:hypothetical protein
MAWNSQQAPIGRMHPPEQTPRQSPPLFLATFYLQAILRPSERLFARIAEYARWRLVWLQLLTLVMIPVIVALLRILLRDFSTGVNAHSNIFLSTLGILTASASAVAFIVKIVAIPVFFLVGTALQFAMAKILGGRGGYVSHCFSMQTYQIPLAIIGACITVAFIMLHFSTLFFSSVISLALFAYGIFLNVLVVRGVHNIARDKAIVAVLTPYIAGALVIFGILAAIANSIAGTINAIR